MRGASNPQASMFALINPEDMVPRDHPIREIKRLADTELKRLSAVFDEMYSATGRPSIPPERLLKACLLIALFSIRSERQFCEQLGYNLLFKWFLDMEMIEAGFDASTFAKNKERLLKADVARLFFEGVVRQAKQARLLSADHFTVDGTLIEAWASMKSFRKKGEGPKDGPPDDPGNPTVDFHGEKRSNATHESSTDPEAKLARKGPGKEAKLAFSAHVLMENRNGLCVDISVAPATGTAEREQALAMVRRRKGRDGIRLRTLGADKGYDVASFVDELRAEGITPHVAAKARQSALDRRTTTWASYAISQRCRKKVEEIFGWMKTVGGFRKTRYRGVARTGLWAYLVGAAYNLVRMARLIGAEEAAA
jgi:transposase